MKYLLKTSSILFASGLLIYHKRDLLNAQEFRQTTIESVPKNFNKGENEKKVIFKEAIKDSVKLLEEFRVKSHVPGLTVAVSYKGKEIWATGKGFADLETKALCKSETVMRIASISKSITMVLLGKLLEQNKLDLDKSIYNYLEGKFPKKTYNKENVEITLRHLVSHLSGIRHYKYKSDDNKEFSSTEYYINEECKSVFDSLKYFKDDDLLSKPGTKYLYTTYGFSLISAVIQSVLEKNQKFETELLNICRKEFGMTNTYLDENEPIIANRCKFYITKNGQLINVPQVNNSYKWAGGGLLSNVHDLIKFGNVMLYSYLTDNGYLKQSTMNLFWTPVENSKVGGPEEIRAWCKYGMGWVVMKNAIPKFNSAPKPLFNEVYFHTGAAVGATSILLIVPEQELVVCILVNLGSCKSLSNLAFSIVKNFNNALEIKN